MGWEHNGTSVGMKSVMMGEELFVIVSSSAKL